MARPSKQINIEPWLKGLLSAGRRKAEDVLAAAIASGYATDRSARTLRRVKAALGIVSEQDGEMWYWRDPAIAQPIVLPNAKTSEPAVPVENVKNVKPGNTPGLYMPVTKFRTISPEEIQANIALSKRRTEQQDVVTSEDPFKLLQDASIDEVEEMSALVEAHRADLKTRSNKLRFRKAWEVTERVERQVTTKEWSKKKGMMVDVPAVEIDETRRISDVPVEGAKQVEIPDGYEPDEAISLQLSKWGEWQDRARERKRQLGVLAT